MPSFLQQIHLVDSFQKKKQKPRSSKKNDRDEFTKSAVPPVWKSPAFPLCAYKIIYGAIGNGRAPRRSLPSGMLRPSVRPRKPIHSNASATIPPSAALCKKGFLLLLFFLIGLDFLTVYTNFSALSSLFFGFLCFFSKKGSFSVRDNVCRCGYIGTQRCFL